MRRQLQLTRRKKRRAAKRERRLCRQIAERDFFDSAFMQARGILDAQDERVFSLENDTTCLGDIEMRSLANLPSSHFETLRKHLFLGREVTNILRVMPSSSVNPGDVRQAVENPNHATIRLALTIKAVQEAVAAKVEERIAQMEGEVRGINFSLRTLHKRNEVGCFEAAQRRFFGGLRYVNRFCIMVLDIGFYFLWSYPFDED
ncbi:hypothetical protein ACFLX2_01450 [Candidatus Dependentiae bacterium]